MRTSAFWSSPVLESVVPVIERSRSVQTSEEAVRQVAGWMAYEAFGMPDGLLAFDVGNERRDLIDVVMFVNTLNFAFTDFSTSTKFEVEHLGRRWSDSDAMFACIHRALSAGEPLLEGRWMASVTRADLERIFTGNIEMPLLDERVSVLREVGETLEARFEGRFHRWADTCAPAMYASGDGLLERMVVDFPRFNDVSEYEGQPVRLFKLAQLSLWMLHAVLGRIGEPGIADLDRMTAFADYIVPVALRLLGITRYADDLEERINTGVEIPRDSDEEIEIRAHTLYATALLTDAINELRPPALRIVVPQLDYRLWRTYHATFWPHHLTRTIMY